MLSICSDMASQSDDSVDFVPDVVLMAPFNLSIRKLNLKGYWSRLMITLLDTVAKVDLN